MKRLYWFLLALIALPAISLAGAGFTGIDKLGSGEVILHFSGGDITIPSYASGNCSVTMVGSSNGQAMGGVTSASCHYARSGKMIMLQSQSSTTGAGTATGAVEIHWNGAPASDSSQNIYCYTFANGAVLPSDGTTHQGQLGCLVGDISGTPVCDLQQTTSSGTNSTSVSAVGQTSGVTWYLNCMYPAASPSL